MAREEKMAAMGLAGVPEDYFSDKSGLNYRFYIAEDIVKAKVDGAGKRIEDRDSFVVDLYRDSPKVALYVHVPWCVETCTYCYYWGKIDSRKEMARLLEAEKQHARLLDDKIGMADKGVPSIYFGGGTPTVLPADLLRDCLSYYSDRYAERGSTELSCEASVSSLNGEKFDVLEEYATRVSIGVQSFNDRILGMVARTFDRAKAIEVLREMGRRIESVNIDLIYGLQTQTLEEWLETVQQATELGVTSVTLYRLEVREGPQLIKSFTDDPASFPDELACREMYHEAKVMLEGAGYRENLVGWFLKPQVQDTKVYRERWEKQTPCIALGPGVQNYGHDYFYYNVADKEEYMERVARGDLPYDVVYRMDSLQQLLWFVMAQWKSNTPVSLGELGDRFGDDLRATFEGLVRNFEGWGLVTREADRLSLSEGGKALLEWMMADLLRDAFGRREIDDRPIYQIDRAFRHIHSKPLSGAGTL